jgi:preprotein translocase subunit SecG
MLISSLQAKHPIKHPNSEYDEGMQRFLSHFTLFLTAILIAKPLAILIYSTNSDAIKNSDGRHFTPI